MNNSTMNDSIGLLICGHGARAPEAQIPFLQWGEQLLRALHYPDGEIGFMEFAQPSIPEAARRLLAKGFHRVLVLPAFVMGARHAREDIPAILQALAQEPAFAGVQIDYIPGIAGHPRLFDALAARCQEALAEATRPPSSAHSELLLVAHGSSDVSANQAVQDLAERLAAQHRLGQGRAAFCAVCEPRIEQVLATPSPSLQQQLILPFFILPSAPVQQLYALVDAATVQQPTIERLKGKCLMDHPLLFEAFRDIIHQKLTEPL